MKIGLLVADLLLGDVHSLKEKRAVLRPVLAALRRLEVSAAESGHLDLHRRAEIGVAVVSGEWAHVRQVLENCERLLADNPELQVLSVRVRELADTDLD
ncbi:MAG: hypothetical protein JWN61_1981 [Pseudonocardiales bacterium]|nr:hypothetical protein [Jatrophihabitantaceae bacterium]MCW2603846.1 hypothetical protein [Pseudonocardiales bacterium]